MIWWWISWLDPFWAVSSSQSFEVDDRNRQAHALPATRNGEQKCTSNHRWSQIFYGSTRFIRLNFGMQCYLEMLREHCGGGGDGGFTRRIRSNVSKTPEKEQKSSGFDWLKHPETLTAQKQWAYGMRLNIRFVAVRVNGKNQLSLHFEHSKFEVSWNQWRKIFYLSSEMFYFCLRWSHHPVWLLTYSACVDCMNVLDFWLFWTMNSMNCAATLWREELTATSIWDNRMHCFLKNHLKA